MQEICLQIARNAHEMRFVMMVNASVEEVMQATDERVPENHLVNGSFTSSVKWIDKTFEFLEFSVAVLSQ